MKPLLLLLMKRLLGVIGMAVLADKMRLGLTVELHHVGRLMLLVLRLWMKLRLLRSRHRRGVNIMELRHLRSRMHIAVHGRHVRPIIALEMLRLLLLVLDILGWWREVVELVSLVDGAAHGVRSIRILRPRGPGLGHVLIHLVICSLGWRLLAVEGRPRRHGASKCHRCGRMGGVYPGAIVMRVWIGCRVGDGRIERAWTWAWGGPERVLKTPSWCRR